MRAAFLGIAGLLLGHGVMPLRAQTSTEARGLLAELMPINQAADWLRRYDRIAWVTSDSVSALPPAALSRLGPEWFCDTIAGLWHAFYGRFDPTADRYEVAIHYRVGQEGIPRSSSEAVDSARLTALARALYHTRLRLPPAFLNSGLRFNWVVQRPGNGGILVTVLPAFQANGVLAFGGEAHYLWDEGGTALRDSTFYFSGFRGVRPDTTLNVVIPADDTDLPTVGQLFFLFSYHGYFHRLSVRTRRAFTSIFVGEDGHEALITVPRDSASSQRPS